jgi:hypothetical protein
MDPVDKQILADQAKQKTLRNELSRLKVQREKIIRSNHRDDLGRAKQKLKFAKLAFNGILAFGAAERAFKCHYTGIISNSDYSEVPGWKIERSDTISAANLDFVKIYSVRKSLLRKLKKLFQIN